MQEQGLGVWRLSNERCADFGRVALDAPIEEQKQQFASLRGQIDDPGLRVFYCTSPRNVACNASSACLPWRKTSCVRCWPSRWIGRRLSRLIRSDPNFDYRIAERNVLAKTLKVQLSVMPRVQLDAELGKLAACGITLDGVDCWRDEPGSGRSGLNLLPPDRRIKHKNQRLRLNLILAAAALFLLVFAMWLSLANRQASLDAMTAEVQKAQNDAKQTSAY